MRIRMTKREVAVEGALERSRLLNLVETPSAG